MELLTVINAIILIVLLGESIALTVFLIGIKVQLRADRKRGGWIKDNIQQGGDRKSKLLDTTLISTLREIGVSKAVPHDGEPFKSDILEEAGIKHHERYELK